MQNKITKRLVVVVVLSLFVIGLSDTIDFNCNISRYSEFQDISSILDQFVPQSNQSIPKDSNSDLLYSTTQSPLVINESAILVSTEQYEIGNGSLDDYGSKNTSYFLDATHGWSANKYDAKIESVEDQRQWNPNPTFGADEIMNATVRVECNYHTSHPYANSQSYVLVGTIDGNNCNYMRLHFTNITMESGADYIILYDQSGKRVDNFTDSYLDVLTPWYNASKIVVRLYSDSSINDWGCKIDYFEISNNTLPQLVDTSRWSYYSKYREIEAIPSRFKGNSTEPLNRTGLWAQIGGIPDSGYYTYYSGDESGFQQNITIPRGELINAWLSFDYLVWHGIATNDLFLFIKINNQLIYTKGFRTVADNGNIHKWTSTGLINMQLWENSSSLFPNYLISENISLSFGILASASVSYSGFAERQIQRVYFDNIELILKTRANVTQPDIDFRINNISITTSNLQWGTASIHLEGLWLVNPIQFLFSTKSPYLTFKINSNLSAYHLSNSCIESNSKEGVQLTITPQNLILWEWDHNVYSPPLYSNFSFEIEKPQQWNIIEVLDPTRLTANYEGGTNLDSFVKINSSFAFYPGWWRFRAVSVNLLSTDQTLIWTNTEWTNLSEYDYNHTNFDVNDTFCVMTTILENKNLIENLDSTWLNLSIYTPIGSLWIKESISLDETENILFNPLQFGSTNTTAGFWSFSLLWNNGTSAGGVKGIFELHHYLDYRILYPKDLGPNLVVERFLGDIISIRLALNDSFTGILVTNAKVSVNLSIPIYLTEVSTGIYDGSYDSAVLTNLGVFFMNFSASCDGFYDLSFLIEFHIIQETDFQVLSVDSDITLGQNFSMTAFFNIKGSSAGLNNAVISVNCSSQYYVSQSGINGQYQIIVNSSTFNHTGIHFLQLNISKPNYQSQCIRERISITPKSVDFLIFVNNLDCTKNRSANVWINSLINFYVKIQVPLDSKFLDHGDLQLIDQNCQSYLFLPEQNQFKLILNTSNFGIGIHYLTLVFNETDYAITTCSLQINILQKPVFFSLRSNSTIICSPNHQFQIELELKDQESLFPIYGAQISYAWIFGSGYLIESDNGIYYLNASTPYQLGTYEIQITILVGETYRPHSFQVQLINQKDPSVVNSTLWWIILIVSIITMALLMALIKYNWINPMRIRKMLELEKRTQIFDDIQNIQDIMVIQKTSGLLLYNYNYDLKKEEQDIMVTGFLQAIMLFTSNVIEKDTSHSHGDGMEFHHNHFNIYVVDGVNVRVAIILSHPASSQIKSQAHTFLKQFEQTFMHVIGEWDGNTEIFRQVTTPLIEEIFQIVLMKNFTFASASYVKEFVHSKIKPNSVTDRVFKIIETLVKDRKYFRIMTVISLIPEIDRIYAKESLLELIQQKVIVPLRGDFEKHLVVEEKRVTRLILYPVTTEKIEKTKNL